MELYAMDKDLNLLGIVENYNSLRWLTEYNGLGEFQLILNTTPQNVEFAKRGNLLWKNDGKNVMVVEYAQKKENEIELRGRSYNKFLTERIVMKSLSITNVEKGIRKAINDNAILSRPIPYLTLGSEKGFTDTTKKQTTYSQLNEVIENFIDIGYEIAIDFTTKKMVFNLYKGEDVSSNIVFSQEFDNIINSLIKEDDTKYRNYAIIGGRGEGENRKIVYLDLRKEGEELRELYVDADDIEISRYDDDGTEIPFTELEIEELLLARGREKLEELQIVDEFTFDIVPNGNYLYGIDYKLGDIVTCKSAIFNIQLKVRITSIQQIYDDNGYSIYATLNNLGE